jgi:hypothetical protein
MTENALLEYFQNVKKNFAALSMWTFDVENNFESA